MAVEGVGCYARDQGNLHVDFPTAIPASLVTGRPEEACSAEQQLECHNLNWSTAEQSNPRKPGQPWIW